MPAPNGLEKCPVCGENKGTVKGEELDRFWEKDEFVDNGMREFDEYRTPLSTGRISAARIPAESAGAKSKLMHDRSGLVEESCRN